MNCTDLTNQLDDYIDGALDPAQSMALDLHLASCDRCKQRVLREQELRKRLRDYGDSTMPAVDAAYFDQALAVAARKGRKQQQRRAWMTGFGSAVAAGIAIWVVSGLWFLAPLTPDAAKPGLPAITIALAEEKTVNLVFSSASALQGATLTVLLPEGVEIAGYEGRRRITWMTDLSEGRNLLPLRLIGTLPAEGELLATLKHGKDDRTFRLRVDVS